jgi:hypothetical protein
LINAVLLETALEIGVTPEAVPLNTGDETTLPLIAVGTLVGTTLLPDAGTRVDQDHRLEGTSVVLVTTLDPHHEDTDFKKHRNTLQYE